MKKLLTLVLALLLAFSLVACGGEEEPDDNPDDPKLESPFDEEITLPDVEIPF